MGPLFQWNPPETHIMTSLNPWTIEWPAPSLHHLLALVQGIFEYFWCLPSERYFWLQKFNLFSKSVFVGKPWKAPKTNVPWPRVASINGGALSSQAVHPLSADLDLGSFNATIVIESETAGCIGTLTPWGSVRLEIHDLKQVMFIDILVSLWLESCLSTWNTTNNKSLLTVYSLRLIDTQPDSHWKFSNTFCKRTKHLSKRVPPSGVNQPISICSSKKSIESLLSLGILLKPSKPVLDMKQNETIIMDSWILFSVSGWFYGSKIQVPKGMVKFGHIELWGSTHFEPLLGSVDFQLPIGSSLI